MFIYTDIIQPQITGSVKTRLLYTMPYEGPMRGEYTHVRPDFIQYVYVEKTLIKNITFQITDEHGINIPFLTSSVPNFIKLHFKKV